MNDIVESLKDAESATHALFNHILQDAREEIERLRAKIDQMERQEPVAAQHRFRHPQKTMPNWSIWQPCAISTRPAWAIDSQGYEVEYRSLYALPGAKEPEPTRDWWDCLIADISAIDCMYRGSPTYAHDAYWLRDRVVWLLKKRRDTLPGAQPQLNEIKITLQRALELGRRETWTGARKHRSWKDQREEQQCWNKVWSLLGAKE